jgi:serine protease AprX
LGWRAGLAAALAAGGLLVAPSTSDRMTSTAAASPRAGGVTERVIVETDGQLLDVSRAAVAAGAKVVAAQATLGTLVLDAPAGTANRLRAVPGVTRVTPDGNLQLLSSGVGPTGQGGDMTNVARLTGATTFWANGHDGSGVDIALLDSGVVPVEGLSTPNKLVIGPDLSSEGANDDLRHLDTYGHGTHMAGIIAGRDSAATPGTYAEDTTNFLGMAPGARIVSIKLADAQGRTQISQAIAAIDWVLTHRRSHGLNIRVINLSFAVDKSHADRFDPLAHAASIAWERGVVVVAAAGNDRGVDDKRGLASPASADGALGVGALDTQGTVTPEDDKVPGWSRTGNPSLGLRGPDLTAPGTAIVSLRARNAFLDERHPAGAVSARFFRGSGTSQSTAIVSGAVALLLSQRPDLKPDQVRDILRRSADPLPFVSQATQGAGSLDLADAHRTSTRPVATTMADFEVLYDGDRRSLRHRPSGHRIGLPTMVRGSWTGSPLNGATWAGATWAGATWAGATWAGATWAGATWAGATWAGNAWSGATWAGATWAGATWAGVSWE